MAYSPEYSAGDLKKISVDTAAGSMKTVKDQAPDLVGMQAASIVTGVGTNTTKKMLKALTPRKMR